MAKAVKAFYGNSTYGTPVEVAQSESGVWYFRVYEFNGYGKAWSRWQKEPDQEVDYNGSVMYWGFNKMYEYKPPLNFRLPN